jgi:hypothetical protein
LNGRKLTKTEFSFPETPTRLHALNALDADDFLVHKINC